jgi:hypothetical protein
MSKLYQILFKLGFWVWYLFALKQKHWFVKKRQLFLLSEIHNWKSLKTYIVFSWRHSQISILLTVRVNADLIVCGIFSSLWNEYEELLNRQAFQDFFIVKLFGMYLWDFSKRVLLDATLLLWEQVCSKWHFS